jgi:aspartate aminotransferase
MINESMYQLGSKPSCIRELFMYGLKQAAIVGKENVYDFSIGNPSVPAPQAVTDAFRAMTAQEDTLAIHSYTPAGGAPDARKAVADNLAMRTGTPVRPENVFFTCGAAPALVSVLRALAVENSEVIGITPYFPEYRPFSEYAGHKYVVCPADFENFQINFSELEKCITPNTQAIIVNSPNNPSGAVYTKETLETLAQLLNRKNEEYGHPIYVIADEPYRELTYDGAYVHYIPEIYPNTVICYSYSKVFSLPGERIGYFFIPDCVTDGERLFAAAAGAARIMGHVCAPSLQQQVVRVCADVKPDLTEYDRNRTVLYDALTSYGYTCVKPQGAFYLFVKAPYGTAKEFSDKAKLENLLIVPGDDFGCPEYFRASTCVSYEMIKRSLPVFKRLIEDR